MNTNQLSAYVQITQDIADTVLNLKPELLTIVGCIIIGYLCKFTPRFPNNYIPPVVILAGPAIYWCIGVVDMESAFFMHYPGVRLVILGFIWGFSAWAIHNRFLKHTIDKWFFGDKPDANKIPDSGHA